MRIAKVIVLAGLLAAQQLAWAESENAAEPSHFWGGINMKLWNVSFNPSGSYGTTKSTEPNVTVALGYDNFFWTLTFTGNHNYTSPSYPGGRIEMREESMGLGYNFNANVAVVLGQKTVQQLYGPNWAGFTPQANTLATSVTHFTTAAALFNWAVPDSKASLFGSLGYGQGSAAAGGSKQNYQGVEFGVAYRLFTSAKVSVGYKAESFGMPNTIGYGTTKKSGVFAGLGVTF